MAEKDAYVAVGSSTVIVSADGLRWTGLVARPPMVGVDSETRSVSYGNGLFVAVGGRVYTSTNAQEWVLATDFAALQDVTYFADAFWGVGPISGRPTTQGVVAYSPDGHAWAEIARVQPSFLFTVTPFRDRLVIVGGLGTVLVSKPLSPYFSSTATRVLDNGDFLMTLRAFSATPIAVEFSEDLRTWQPLEVLLNLPGSATIIDSGASGSQRRFYRAVLLDHSSERRSDGLDGGIGKHESAEFDEICGRLKVQVP